MIIKITNKREIRNAKPVMSDGAPMIRKIIGSNGSAANKNNTFLGIL